MDHVLGSRPLWEDLQTAGQVEANTLKVTSAGVCPAWLPVRLVIQSVRGRMAGTECAAGPLTFPCGLCTPALVFAFL